jgi:hypothetical protein
MLLSRDHRTGIEIDRGLEFVGQVCVVVLELGDPRVGIG